MIITGKAIEFFSDYFKWHYEYDRSSYSNLSPDIDLLEGFFRMPLPMQFGVFVDWFDSVGLEIMITLNEQMQFSYAINGEHCSLDEGYESRTEARSAAIEGANLIFNRKIDQQRNFRRRQMENSGNSGMV